jgi:hypothetical protein
MQFMDCWRARPARIFFVTLTLALPAFVVGCQSAAGPTAGEQALSQIQQGPSAERNELGLNRVDVAQGQGILYVKAPRPHLERFDRLALDPVAIEPEEGDLPWNAAVTNRLRKSFTRSLKQKLEKQDTWKLTDEPGSGVLKLRVKAREPNLTRNLPHVGAARDAPKQPASKTTLVMELYDSETGEVLVQFIQRRDLPPQVEVGSRVRVDRLRVFYSRFADSLGDSLGQLAQAVEDVRVDDGGEGEGSQ